MKADLIDGIAAAITDFYGENPQTSDSYGRIVSDRHFARLQSMMSGGTVVVGGETDATTRFIAPTVLDNVDASSQLMNEEIFGPLLPIIGVSSTDEAISYITERPHPLALYVFGENKDVVDSVVHNTTAGGVTVNGTLMHITNPHLPFGGIGESGMGAYHGQSGVRVFQHMKPVLTRSTKIDPSLAYPPYTARKAKLFRRFL